MCARIQNASQKCLPETKYRQWLNLWFLSLSAGLKCLTQHLNCFVIPETVYY